MPDILKTIVETPAATIDSAAKTVRKLPRQRPIRVAQKYWGTLGPGLTTGAADDDPSGIATYSQAGAQFGLNHIWLALYTIPFIVTIQEMCARIGIVTGRGLGGVIRKHYPPWLGYGVVTLLFFANTLNIGADIEAMAAATHLLLPFRLSYLAVFFTVVILFLQIGYPYERYARILKLLTLSLLAYVATAFVVSMDWRTVTLHTFIPTISFSKDNLFLLTAILGTTISPYLFFWQASQEIEEEERHGARTLADRQQTDARQILAMRKDVVTGMVFSNLAMFFIIAVGNAVLHSHNVTINTAADAANALRPLAGNYAFLLFAIGIIGVGLLGIPVLSGSASYAISETMHWSYGLDKKLSKAYAFYGVIILATVVGLALNFVGVSPIRALILSAFINGVISPLLIFVIVMISNNRTIMGEWKNGAFSNVFGWTIGIMMLGVAAASIIGSL